MPDLPNLPERAHRAEAARAAGVAPPSVDSTGAGRYSTSSRVVLQRRTGAARPTRAAWGLVDVCGRFTLTRTGRELAEAFNLPGAAELTPRFNIAPGQEIAIIRGAPGTRALGRARWGLIPSWARDPSIGNRLVNARSETAADKPAFRNALRQRRCAVPADGFYEWSGPKGARRAHWFRVRGDAFFAIAGLWERWLSPDGTEIVSCTLLTTQANAGVRPIHARMPVILLPEQVDAWLAPVATSGAHPLLGPCPSAWIGHTALGPRVNDARNEGPECVAAPRPDSGADSGAQTTMPLPPDGG